MGEDGLILCRTCLSSVNKLFYFSDLIFPDHFLKFLDISFNQYTSKYICYLCLNILKKIVTFKEQCSIVNKLFIDLTQQLQDVNDSTSAVICSPVFYNISQVPVIIQTLPDSAPEKALETTEGEVKEISKVEVNEIPEVECNVTSEVEVNETPEVNDKYFEENITEEYLDDDSTEETILEDNVTEENIEAKDKDSKMSSKENKPLKELDVTKNLSLDDFNIIPYIKKNDDINNAKVDKRGNLNKIGIAQKKLVVNDLNSTTNTKNKGVNKGVNKIAMAMARADLVNIDKLSNAKVDKGFGMHKVGIPKRDLIVNRVSSGYSKTRSSKIKDTKKVKTVHFNDLFSKDKEKEQGSKNGTLNNNSSKKMTIKNNVLNSKKGNEEFLMDLDMSVDEEDCGTNKYENLEDDTDDEMEVEMLDDEIETDNEDDDSGSDVSDEDDPLTIGVDENSAEHKDVLANKNTKLFSRMTAIKDRIKTLENFANLYSVDIKFLSRVEQMSELSQNKDCLTNFSFLCNMCVLAFSDLVGYKDHMSLHERSAGDFACAVCYIRFKTKFLKFKHMSEKHLKLFTCTKCGKTSKNKSDVKQHFIACHYANRQNTNKNPSTNQSSNQNLQSDGQDGNSINKPGAIAKSDACLNVCEICEFIEFSQKALRKHKEDVHKGMVRCEKCKREFANATAIEIHRKGEYCNSGYFPCVVCGMHYRSESQVRKHVLRQHRHSYQYQCYTCNTKFKDKEGYKKHALDVHSPRQYTCDICSMIFQNHEVMVAHRRSHAVVALPVPVPVPVPGHRPYKCLECHCFFKTVNDLTSHSRFHALCAPAPYSCGECGAAFKESRDLSLHVKSHSRFHALCAPAPYSCGECGAAFKESRDLSLHVKQHASQRLVCKECNESFSSDRTLLRHMKLVHEAATNSAL